MTVGCGYSIKIRFIEYLLIVRTIVINVVVDHGCGNAYSGFPSKIQDSGPNDFFFSLVHLVQIIIII